MLTQKSPSRLRLLAGAAIVAVLTAGAGVAAWAAQAPTVTVAQSADNLDQLASDVSAVFDGNRLMLSETEHDVTSTRILEVGDEYRDGWRMASINDAYAVLSKGETRRVITFTGKQGEAAPQPLVAAVGSTDLTATNAAPGGDRMSIEAAVAAGDLRQVVVLGGKPDDVARAFALRSPTVRTLLNEGADAVFEGIGLMGTGSRQLSVMLTSTLYPNRQAVIVVPELADLPIPSGARSAITMVPDGYYGRPSWVEPGVNIMGGRTPDELRLDLSRAAEYLVEYGSPSDRLIGLQMREDALTRSDEGFCRVNSCATANPAPQPTREEMLAAPDNVRLNMVRLAETAPDPEIRAQYQQRLADYDARRQPAVAGQTP